MDRIFYTKPAQKWEEALPLGNGRVGAMIYGTIGTENIQLNEDSIWYGSKRNRVNPDAFTNLDKVRKLLNEEKIVEAEELLQASFSGNPESQRHYQPLGNLLLEMKNSSYQTNDWGQTVVDTACDYQRSLYLDKAISNVEYSLNGVRYTREFFCSFPNQIVAIRLNADQGSKINFDAILRRGRYFDACSKIGHGMIMMEGNLGRDGIQFCTAIKIETFNGSVANIGERVVVRDADEVVIYLAAETSFYHTDWKKVAIDRLEDAHSLGYELLKEKHILDHHNLFNRMRLFLSYDYSLNDLPTDIRLSRFQKNEDDNGLIQLYFDYGRYLMIAGSRPGSQAMNLQGIWNNEMTPSWDSKYTININTQMNYWPAEVCGLSDCHMPLFDLIHRIAETGKNTAEEMYGCRGFVAHHNTDIWGDSAPQDTYVPATYWVLGGAWLCTHIMIHYRYTLDLTWLRGEYIYLENAVLFFHDFLLEEDGEVYLSPSVSPENTYIMPNGELGRVCKGCTMDSGILWDLFTGFLEASDVLNIDNEITVRTKELLSKLPPLQIGKHGQIMEWRKDYDEVEPGHRHISQLYSLHPSFQIDVDTMPDLALAAEKTLERRLTYGGGHTGWSAAWLINFYARLRNSEKAWMNLCNILKKSTFSNLMDNHPRGQGHVFQIDGNFGAVAGIMEMLIQGDEDNLKLLPALPTAWNEGEVHGARIPGAKLVDFAWKDGKIISSRVYSM